MTTTARHHIARLAATISPDVAEELLFSGHNCCQLCELASADLYWRIDGRDGEEIQICANCAETADVLPLPDCD